MIKKITACLDFVIYYSIILIPFFMAISPAPMNVFMGLLIFAYMLKKVINFGRIIPRTPINLPLFLFFVLTCLSLVYSVSFKDTFRGGVLRLLSFASVALILCDQIRGRRHLKLVFLSCFAGLSLASLDGIWQVIYGKDFIRGYLPVVNFDLVRATASFNDPNSFGVYLSALAPVIFGLALYYLKRGARAASVLISLVVLAAIALTFSRPTLLAVYVVFILFAVVKKDKALAIALIVLTLASPFLLPGSVKNWAKSVDYNPLRFMCNDDRIAIYRNTINMIKDHPVRGVGANVFMKNYQKYKESPEYRNVVTADYHYAHNNFLHIAGELGLTGFAVFIWLLYRLFRGCINIYRRLEDKFFKIASLSVTACLVSFLVNGLTESSLYYSRLALIFWYLAGLSLGLGKFIDADKAR